MIKKYCRSYIVLFAVFTVVSLVSAENWFFAMYPCIFMGIIPINMCAYDEKEKWFAYSGTLPIAKAQIVSAKNIVAMGCVCVGIVISGAVWLITLKVNGLFVLSDYLTFVSYTIAVSLIAPAMISPLVFKFGAEKGRIGYYIVIGLVCAIGVFFMKSSSNQAVLAIHDGGSAVILAAAVLFFGLSWLISISLYKSREF